MCAATILKLARRWDSNLHESLIGRRCCHYIKGLLFGGGPVGTRTPILYVQGRCNSLYTTSPIFGAFSWDRTNICGVSSRYMNHHCYKRVVWWNRAESNPSQRYCKYHSPSWYMRPHCFLTVETVALNWRSRRESNPRIRIDSPTGYHYIT